jgi:hypothetical protein
MGFDNKHLRGKLEGAFIGSEQSASDTRPLSRLDVSECAYYGTVQALRDAGITK